MNEFVTELLDMFPFEVLENRSWLEVVSILAPSVLIIIGLYGTSFLLKKNYLKKSIYIICLSLALFFLPYELFRQATEMSKADANVTITQTQLKELLNTTSLSHIEPLTDKAMAANTLIKLTHGLSDTQKQELILVSWLIAANEEQLKLTQNKIKQQLVDDIKLNLNNVTEEIISSRTPFDRISDSIGEMKYQLTDNIRLNLEDVTKEIIDSRTPFNKISDVIIERIDSDVSDLINTKMQSLNEGIDQSLTDLEEGINAFIQIKLEAYEVTLDSIMQKNLDELKQHTNQAKNSFAKQVGQINKSNKVALQKLEETQKGVDDLGVKLAEIDLNDVIDDVQKLAGLVKDIQERNETLFKYNECLRSVGLIDFSGKEKQCREQLQNRED